MAGSVHGRPTSTRSLTTSWPLVAAILAPAAAVAATVGYGSRRWRAVTSEIHARLEAARRPIVPATFDPAELQDLPAPVQRYFRTALTEGQRMVAAVDVEHAGTFNMSDVTEQWRPFTSRQRIVAGRPGFDWEARISLAPLVAVWVHDAYVAGEGMLQASVLGIRSLADERGTPALARGELIRLLAEMAWYPTALLPSQGVRWRAVDDRSATASLEDGGASATLLFLFDDSGLIESVRADARPRGSGDAAVPTPWEGRFGSYESRHGMRVPIDGEVAWMLRERRDPYWRGRITKLDYEWAL